MASVKKKKTDREMPLETLAVAKVNSSMVIAIANKQCTKVMWMMFIQQAHVQNRKNFN